MIIELEDKRIPLGKELKPKVKFSELCLGLVIGSIWIAIIYSAIRSAIYLFKPYLG